MASNRPPGRFLPRPLPYNVPSASRNPDQTGAIGGNTPQGPPSLPREPTQASDPVIHQHLLANPHLSEFHSAARGHAIDRSSPANFNLNLASLGPSSPPPGAIDLADLVEPSDPILDQYLLANPHPSEFLSAARGHATRHTSLNNLDLSFASAGPGTPSQGGIDPPNLPYHNQDPVCLDVRPYLQENPDVAAFYNAVSSHGTYRTSMIDVDFNSFTDSPASMSNNLHRAPSVFSPVAGTPESVPIMTIGALIKSPGEEAQDAALAHATTRHLATQGSYEAIGQRNRNLRVQLSFSIRPSKHPVRDSTLLHAQGNQLLSQHPAASALNCGRPESASTALIPLWIMANK
ncbi:MAG: hypothetical protein Q9201_000705 [Fulgogasparrea decipioides]